MHKLFADKLANKLIVTRARLGPVKAEAWFRQRFPNLSLEDKQQLKTEIERRMANMAN